MKTVIASAAAIIAAVAVGLYVAGMNGSAKTPRASSVEEKLRKPAVAGMFYPADRKALERMVKETLAAATKGQYQAPVKAILAPHAGYIYCGRTMAAAFKQIEGASFNYDKVIMIGPSHRVSTRAAALSSATAWETPMGAVSVDAETARNFVQASDRIEFNDAAHAMEHSLEVQLPYLIAVAAGKPFKIVPVITNSQDPLDHEIVARALADLAGDPRTLIVISSDLSHFPSAGTAETVDKAILNAVTSLDAEKLSAENRKLLKAGYQGVDCTMCGLDATLCVARAASALGIREARIVDYTHSGMVAGDPNRVVGYGAVVFLGSANAPARQEAEPLTLKFDEQARQEVLCIARSAVEAAVQGEWVQFDPSDNPALQVKAGCFVTLKNRGVLRGCIGRFQSDAPLWKTVREMAISSATRDFRFVNNPISFAEVPDLDIEISVLSPMREICNPLEEIKLGRDGIVITDQGKSGTFLPQVATETGWTLVEFLGHCARDKAGLAWDGWRSPTCRIYAYTATIICKTEEAQHPISGDGSIK